MQLANTIERLFNIKILEKYLLGPSLRDLYFIMGGHIYFQTLVSAIKFDLFTKMDESQEMTKKQIAMDLGLEEQPCRILLLGLTTIGLIKKSGDFYVISKISKILLSQRSDTYIGNVILWQHYINYRAMFHFYDSLKAHRNLGLQEFKGNEPFLYGRLAHDQELELIFQKAMAEISNQSIKHFTKYVDLRGIRYLVDVGGGSGNNLMTIAKKNRSLSGAVFDSPTVCEIARENIQKNGLADRLGVIAGDCFKDSFPEKADAILFCHFFTIWSAEHNKQLIKKTFAGLPKGGKMIIFNMIQWDTEDGPMSAAMGSPYFLTLATGEGMLYTKREYVDWMKSGGFGQIEVIDLPWDHVAIVGTKL